MKYFIAVCFVSFVSFVVKQGLYQPVPALETFARTR